MKAELEQVKPESITLLVNSPGGDPQEAFAIADVLQDYRPYDAKIVGTAASAATILPALADKVSMTFGGRYMIHNVWTQGVGDARKFRDLADELESYTADMATMYAEKTGQPVADIRRMMDKETWMTAKQAYQEGFVDQVLDLKPQACAGLELFNYAKESLAPPLTEAACEAEIRRLRAHRERQAQLAKLGVFS